VPGPPLRIPFASLVPDAKFEIGGARDFTATADAFWILERTTGTVSRVDPLTNRVVGTATVGKGACVALAADFGSVLVPQCPQKTVARVDAKTNAIGDPLPVPLSPIARSIATGVGSVWIIADAKGTIARVDPVEKTVVALIDLPAPASSLAFGADALWAASAGANTVTRINPYNNLVVETIAVPGGPRDLAVGEGSVWTLNQTDGSVTRIDAKTNAITITLKIASPLGSDARIAFGEGSVWLAGTGTPLVRIEPRTNRVAQIFTGAGTAALAVAHGSLWIGGSPATVWRLDPKRIEATR
jgi:streptogramin lyase